MGRLRRRPAAAARSKLRPGLRPFAAHSLHRRRRLRRLHERGSPAQQSLLQHAPPRLLHHADAAQRRHPARRRPVSRTRCGFRCARPTKRCRRRSASWRSEPAPSPAVSSVRALQLPAASPKSFRSTWSSPDARRRPWRFSTACWWSSKESRRPGLVSRAARAQTRARHERHRPALRSLLHPLRHRGRRCIPGAGALDPDRVGDDRVAGGAPRPGDELSLLVGDAAFRAELWPVLSLGNADARSGSALGALPLRFGPGLPAGVAVFRRLSREIPRPSQPAVFLRALSRPVRLDRPGVDRRAMRSPSWSPGKRCRSPATSWSHTKTSARKARKPASSCWR